MPPRRSTRTRKQSLPSDDDGPNASQPTPLSSTKVADRRGHPPNVSAGDKDINDDDKYKESNSMNKLDDDDDDDDDDSLSISIVPVRKKKKSSKKASPQKRMRTNQNKEDLSTEGDDEGLYSPTAKQKLQCLNQHLGERGAAATTMRKRNVSPSAKSADPDSGIYSSSESVDASDAFDLYFDQEEDNDKDDDDIVVDEDDDDDFVARETRNQVKRKSKSKSRQSVINTKQKSPSTSKNMIHVKSSKKITSQQEKAEQMRKEKVNFLFNVFDEKKRKKIALQDISQIAEEYGHALNNEEIEEMIEWFDSNDDGALDLEDFFEIYNKVNPRKS